MRGEKTSDYEFDLPPALVAQEPLPDRASSRLLVIHRSEERIEHCRFRDVANMIPAGDLLVLNTTRVRRARLLGKRASGAPAEILLLKPVNGGLWEAMVSPGGKVRPGRRIDVGPELSVEVVEITARRTRLVRLLTPLTDAAAIERYGHVPLPPYITRPDTEGDAARYQTVYALEIGSAAAPTAGLHFTRELLADLDRRGVRRAEVVLHVGAGTFKPVEVDDPAAHVMHEEWYSVPPASIEAIGASRVEKRRIWAVGTTSVRTLESAFDETGQVVAAEGETRLFIRPPYHFRMVDHMLTNFHLPRSTLLMLVTAFAGYDLTMYAYREAVARGYRFFSYGDAMLIV